MYQEFPTCLHEFIFRIVLHHADAANPSLRRRRICTHLLGQPLLLRGHVHGGELGPELHRLGVRATQRTLLAGLLASHLEERAAGALLRVQRVERVGRPRVHPRRPKRKVNASIDAVIPHLDHTRQRILGQHFWCLHARAK